MSYSVPGQEVLHQSAGLRGAGRFQEAIDFVQANMGRLDETIVTNGWIECFKAAQEMGDREQATRFAREIAKEFPDFPTIKGYV